jgi:CheY-like chemotaxis protein
MNSNAGSSRQIETPYESTPRPRNLSLLVIDDDPVHRMVISKVGEKAGYKLSTAGTVDDAIKQLETQKFDCISLDLSLGGENGAQLLGIISQHNKQALLVVISGAAARVREETLRLANLLAIKVMEAPKPVDLISLRTKLGTHAAGVKA